MAPTTNVLPGHGFVFLFIPITAIDNTTSAQNLGLFSRVVDGNPTNRVFAVELNVFRNEEFRDINANHVGIDVNSLTFVNSSEAGYHVCGLHCFYSDIDSESQDLELEL
ncbi:hypothetical protein L1987_47980 [Smallanthus sonchifolius]|uniref:Uncharacterized protein n=1 Tax=Smallanthus sonchifolius TaxID=185202 RepID=A0ACB9FR68_9ASTR|nr:hypothetical protein L1987_47980 [Smallanthus sonchifolius]